MWSVLACAPITLIITNNKIINQGLPHYNNYYMYVRVIIPFLDSRMDYKAHYFEFLEKAYDGQITVDIKVLEKGEAS